MAPHRAYVEEHADHVRHAPRRMWRAAVSAIPGALTFRGAADIEVVQHLLEEVTRGDVHSVAFVIPWGAVWSLPAYELALLTATHLQRQSVKDVELTLVTPEVEPCSCSTVRERGRARAAGGARSEAPSRACAASSQTDSSSSSQRAASPRNAWSRPRLQGARSTGCRRLHGFIPVDSHCRVHGVADVRRG